MRAGAGETPPPLAGYRIEEADAGSDDNKAGVFAHPEGQLAEEPDVALEEGSGVVEGGEAAGAGGLREAVAVAQFLHHAAAVVGHGDEHVDFEGAWGFEGGKAR